MTHGTLNSYKNLKCRCDLCAQTSFRYEKRRKYLVAQGLNPTIPAHGFRRRVQALMCIGWTAREIATELNIAPGNLARKMASNTTVRRETHVRMCEVYERLSMTVPTDVTPTTRGVTRVHARTRGIAVRAGYLPPLAWNDIDDADETPATATTSRPKTDVDPVVILRVIAGDRLPMTRAERVAVVTQARALNWSEETIYARTGIAKATDKTRYGDHFPDCGCTPGTAENGWIEKRASGCADELVGRAA